MTWLARLLMNLNLKIVTLKWSVVWVTSAFWDLPEKCATSCFLYSTFMYESQLDDVVPYTNTSGGTRNLSLGAPFSFPFYPVPSHVLSRPSHSLCHVSHFPAPYLCILSPPFLCPHPSALPFPIPSASPPCYKATPLNSANGSEGTVSSPAGSKIEFGAF